MLSPQRDPLDPADFPLTVDDITAAWKLSAYTIQEWARDRLIIGAAKSDRSWQFTSAPRLLVTDRRPTSTHDAHAGIVLPSTVLVDVAAYPCTPPDLARRWLLKPATVRRYANARRITDAVYLPCGWRFGEGARLLVDTVTVIPGGRDVRVGGSRRRRSAPR